MVRSLLNGTVTVNILLLHPIQFDLGSITAEGNFSHLLLW